MTIWMSQDLGGSCEILQDPDRISPGISPYLTRTIPVYVILLFRILYLRNRTTERICRQVARLNQVYKVISLLVLIHIYFLTAFTTVELYFEHGTCWWLSNHMAIY